MVLVCIHTYVYTMHYKGYYYTLFQTDIDLMGSKLPNLIFKIGLIAQPPYNFLSIVAVILQETVAIMSGVCLGLAAHFLYGITGMAMKVATLAMNHPGRSIC